MKLTPIEETLRQIFKKRHKEYEQIAGGTIEPDEIADMLLAEGFAKEPVIRYREFLEELPLALNMLRASSIVGKRLKNGAAIPPPRNPFLGIPPRATGGSW